MSRNLPENHSFRLNEESSWTNDGKLLIFVKLTDSCLKTIENFIKSNKKSQSNVKSFIKFYQQGGEISIPTTSEERKSYSFQISPEDKTPEVFQCIRQINRNSLENCGLIEQRVNIHAQEDVYSMTKSKVTEFQKKEELTKKQTKEIGESSKTILEKKTQKSSSANVRSSTNLSTQSKERTSIQLKDQSKSSTTIPPDRPLRELLIQFLAVRPYRRPDLILQLKNAMKKDEDKEQFDCLLSTLTTLNKLGEYTLLKQSFLNGDVNPQWPFYSKEDSLRVQKRIQDFQTTANRSTISSTRNSSNEISTNSTRHSLPYANVKSIHPTTTTTSGINSSSRKGLIDDRSSIVEQRKQTENEEKIVSNDGRVDQLSQMLEKLTNAIEQIDGNHFLDLEEKEMFTQMTFDEIEKEYQRLLPEYDQLYSYVQTISNHFQILQEDFREHSTNEKASKIVEEFVECERNDGFIEKRQRLFRVQIKLEFLKNLLEKSSFSSRSSSQLNQLDSEDFDDEQIPLDQDNDQHHLH